MGDDIREATRIVKPTPINLEDASSVETTTGSILIVQSSEIDPRIKFDSPLGGQISQITTIEYLAITVGATDNGWHRSFINAFKYLPCISLFSAFFSSL